MIRFPHLGPGQWYWAWGGYHIPPRVSRALPIPKMEMGMLVHAQAELYPVIAPNAESTLEMNMGFVGGAVLDDIPNPEIAQVYARATPAVVPSRVIPRKPGVRFELPRIASAAKTCCRGTFACETASDRSTRGPADRGTLLNWRRDAMHDIFNLTDGPVRHTGPAKQDIDKARDASEYDELDFMLTVQESSAGTSISVNLLTALQRESETGWVVAGSFPLTGVGSASKINLRSFLGLVRYEIVTSGTTATFDITGIGRRWKRAE